MIDRLRFRLDKYGGVEGTLEIGDRNYQGSIKTWMGNMEKAWENAERIVTFLETRFVEIETKIKSDLIPDLQLWLDEEDTANLNEVAARVFAAMGTTDPVGFSISDAGASSIFFDGPDFVEGHSIEIQFDAEGRLVCVGLAG